MFLKKCAIILFAFLHLLAVFHSQTITIFDKEHVSVVFDPRIDTWNLHFLDVPTLVEILEVVARKFKKIRTFEIDDAGKEMGKKVLLAVASHNRDHKAVNAEHLEAEITYTISGSGENTTLIKELLKIANRANTIFNGSITTIYLHHDKESFKSLETHLMKAEIIAGQAPFKYNFGIHISFSDANTLCWYMKQKQWPALSRLEYVTLVANHPNFASEAPQQIVQRHIEKILNIKEKFNKIKQENRLKYNMTSTTITVTEATGFAGLKGQRDATLVEYWRRFAKWANETGNKVLFHEAIDSNNKGSYNDESVWLKRGWWRLVPLRGIFGVTNFTLEEKEGVLTDKQDNRQNIAEPDTGLLNSTQVVTICITTCVLLAVVIFVWIYFHKQAVKKILKQSIEQKKHLHNLITLYKSPNPGIAEIFEVSQFNLKIDELHVLGSGSFGVVCAAKLRKNQEWIDVAVKMPTTTDATFGVSALLNEVVVLGHLESHKNIIKLLGVNVDNIDQGKVYVFYEISTHGSVERTLKNIQFHKTVTDNTTVTSVEISEKNLSKDMFYWTIGIAKGMEYLTLKHIIHTDLASRNVLLGNDNEAKICDFGFATSPYVETGVKISRDVELSWRWASPETIIGDIFSEKTDVWSFGVTIWEIFSLAELPYHDLNDCNIMVQQLKHGRKLAEPKLANSNMYGLMTTCWSYHPSLRPTFTDIVKSLEKLAVTYDTVL